MPIVLGKIDCGVHLSIVGTTDPLSYFRTDTFPVFGWSRLLAWSQRLPVAAQVAIAGIAAAAILRPKSREKLVEGWNSLQHSEAANLVWETISQLVLTADSARRDTHTHYVHLHTIVPAQQQRPLLHRVRAVCVAARSGLSLDELERRVRRGGYESQSKTAARS
jgi:hypothetical protein